MQSLKTIKFGSFPSMYISLKGMFEFRVASTRVLTSQTQPGHAVSHYHRSKGTQTQSQ